MRSLLLTTLLFSATVTATAQPEPDASNVEKQMREGACTSEDLDRASRHLLELQNADQASRSGEDTDPSEDTRRRAEVAIIYAEGCLQRAGDFHHAALVFQHGNSPEHFYQAWFFASQAVELGDESAKWLVPRAIDRYLLNTGYKQLFGTNLVTPYIWDSTSEDFYFCLWPVDERLSDQTRVDYGIKPLSELREPHIRSDNEKLNPNTGECSISAESPPRGMFPGIW
jgi:hypothetical protein